MTQLTVRGVAIISGYASNTGGNASGTGRDHAVLTAPLAVGRFRRDSGDALCKPRHRFLGLEPRDIERRPPTCVVCQRRMKRFGP